VHLTRPQVIALYAMRRASPMWEIETAEDMLFVQADDGRVWVIDPTGGTVVTQNGTSPA
jgi:hypothetical protein